MRAGLALAATTLVASPAFAANTLTDLEGDDRGDNHRQRDRRQGPDCVAHHAPAILASFIDKVAQVHLVNAVELLDRLTEAGRPTVLNEQCLNGQASQRVAGNGTSVRLARKDTRVAAMSRGDAGSAWELLKLLGDFLQHARHEIGASRQRSFP